MEKRDTAEGSYHRSNQSDFTGGARHWCLVYCCRHSGEDHRISQEADTETQTASGKRTKGEMPRVVFQLNDTFDKSESESNDG